MMSRKKAQSRIFGRRTEEDSAIYAQHPTTTGWLIA
jgi:hypothetical protein